MNVPDLAAFHLSRRRAAALALLLPCALARAQDAAQEQAPQPPAKPLDVPYVPTPMAVVNKMLDMARVRRGDMLYDLGCGDGRIVVTAAKERGARGLCVDIDPRRIAEARRRAQEAGVEDRVRFIEGNLFDADFAEANVVTLYLLPRINLELRPQLWRQLKLGSRVVSHAFDMGEDWPPEQMQNLRGSTIYAWTIRKAQKDAART
jgi:SAM-dependent methyltransferase